MRNTRGPHGRPGRIALGLKEKAPYNSAIPAPRRVYAPPASRRFIYRSTLATLIRVRLPCPRSACMKFRFPIFIIDEDYRSENASGLGIRALSAAIEAEGVEVIGVTSYGDLSSFAQQQSRASAFILSIDDEEFDGLARGRGQRDQEPARLHRRAALSQRRHPDLPVWRDAHVRAHPERHPARTARLHPHVRGHARVRGAPHHPRSAATWTACRRRSSASW